MTDEYISKETFAKSLPLLYGTANHYLKIWFVLKHMGFQVGSPPVVIDTSNPTESLKRLFSYGDPEGKFFVPFAHTTRWLTMMGDAARSVIQTNISNWSKKSIVTCDPTSFIDIVATSDTKYSVSPARGYPTGLGYGENGFALTNGIQVHLPDLAFAIWYCRQVPIPKSKNASNYIIDLMKSELNISQAEYNLVFKPCTDINLTTSKAKLSDKEINKICNSFINNPTTIESTVIPVSFEEHARKVKSMVTIDGKPSWMHFSSETLLQKTIDSGAKAILLYGPPRTGKTRAIDLLYPRDRPNRATIQIHDGWSYEHLIQGQQPNKSGGFEWSDGVLKKAIDQKKEIIVLEEINRTRFSQALGEVFSLIEQNYRGQQNSILLRDGSSFFIPNETLIIMTMNTVDKSTEDIDDALFGRITSVEFPARIEDLSNLLDAKKIDPIISDKIRQLYPAILEVYPLGHGYFASYNPSIDFILYYLTQIRPVLYNYLFSYKPQELSRIDNMVDQLFGATN
jgi:5-methylcytosine-specific restriction protein B